MGKDTKLRQIDASQATGVQVVAFSAPTGAGAVVGNADTVDLLHAYATPVASALLALDATAKFPISVIPTSSLPGIDASFVTLAAHASLANERVLTAGAGLTLADAGAGAAATLAVGAGYGITVNADDVALASSVAGAGLTYTTGVLAVGQGAGLTVSDDAVALTTPGTLTVSTTNVATGSHTHAVTSSANPGAAASLLASSAAGYLQLVRLGAGVAPAVPLHALATTEQMRLSYDGSNAASFTVGSGGNLTVAPTGDFVFDPTGNDILPATGYDLNIGMLSRKYLTLHVAELWVETLVAQDTIATIGGRVIVAPTTMFTRDVDVAHTTVYVKHNQMQAGDRALCQANMKFEVMAITSAPTYIGVDEYSYTVTRDLDGTGANYWYAGDALVNTGTTGSGFIDLYSLESVFGQIPQYVYNCEAGAQTFSANLCSSSNWTLFGPPADPNANDAVYFGTTGAWGNLYFYIGTAANWNVTVAWEYVTAGHVWVPLVNATLPNLAVAGIQTLLFTFADQAGWVTDTINGVAAMWIRARLSAVTSITTLPVQAGRRVYIQKRAWGPTIAGMVRNSATFNDITEHWAIGNLNGLYGYGADTMGVAVGKYSATTSWLSADATNGIRIMRGDTKLGQWDVDGNFKIGTNITAAGTTNFIVFNAAQAYNGENVTAGDLLLGDNSANKANVLWDYSAGTLLFRSGATTTAYIGTDGTLYNSAGTVRIGTAGIEVDYSAGGVYDGTKAYKVAEGGVTAGGLWGLVSGDTHNVYVGTPVLASGKTGILWLLSQTTDAAATAQMYLRTTNTTTSLLAAFEIDNTTSRFRFTGAPVIAGTTAYADTIDETTGDMAASRSLFVGSTYADPGANNLGVQGSLLAANVGIGATPLYNLHVAAGINDSYAAYIYNAGGDGYGLLIKTECSNIDARPLLALTRASDANCFYVHANGNAWVESDMSALTFTDRTPYPASLAEAYAAVASVQRAAAGGVDHARLDSSIRAVDAKGEPVGRNLSALVSAQNEVIRDLLTRLEALEKAA